MRKIADKETAYNEDCLYLKLKAMNEVVHKYVDEREAELSLVYTSGFRMRLPHCVAIFYKLPWFCSTKVSYEKSQLNAENACGNRMCK